MEDLINQWYYQKHPIRFILWPLSWLYRGIIRVRRLLLTHFFKVTADVPVIVVGNISMGGVGKTPLVLALVEAFLQKGIRVGVVSRGYGATLTQFPHEVQLTDSALAVGDEPLLLAKQCKCPVVIAPKRVKAVQYLVKHYHCQVIISDDGLQHYRMGRAIEIAVIDGKRLMGNGLCLPAGPLREPISRLKSVDFCVVNQGTYPDAYEMTLETSETLTALTTLTTVPFQSICEPISAVAGIGHPQRFFDILRDKGLVFDAKAFNDHHRFELKDFDGMIGSVVMTEKDAVKCQSFAKKDWYFLPVRAKMPSDFWRAFWQHPLLQGFMTHERVS